MKLTRVVPAAFGIALAASTTAVFAGSGAAQAVPPGCVETRNLTSVTVHCPGTTDMYRGVDVDCVGVYLTYGLGPGVGPYTQRYFGNLSEGLTAPCVGGYPNTGLGVVTGVRVG